MKIHVSDLRLMDPIYCVGGTKQFFKDHNMDWRAFCKDGVDEEEFLATKDHMAIKLVEAAHGRRK